MANDTVGQIALELVIDKDKFNEELSKLEKNTENVAEKMKKSFINSAADVKAAFDMVLGSIRMVISSCSGLMTTYQTQIEAEARLAATMRNATSASDAQIQSVKDLASSLQELGVVGDEVQLAGAQELATYVSSTESIKTMLPVLDDMIAQQYGFSASTDSAVTIATMLGKVLQGQTTALSRYGYSFDEAQEQLLKYGTEEERVATLAEVVEESVSGVNKSLADTPTGKVKQLSNDFGDLKETLGSFVTNILYPIVTQLDAIVKKLNEVFATASNSLKSVFGIQDDTGSGIVGSDDSTSGLAEETAEAADSYSDIADSAERAEEANKGSLAAFDELTVLSDNSSNGLATDASGAEDTAANLADEIGSNTAALKIDADTNEAENKISGLLATIKTAWENFKTLCEPLKEKLTELWETLKQVGGFVGENLLNFYKHFLKPLGEWTLGVGLPKLVDIIDNTLQSIDWEKINTALDDLYKALEPYAEHVGEGLLWFCENILSPLTTWVMNDVVPAFLDILSGAVEVLDGVLQAAKDVFVWFWDEFLSPIAEWTGGVIVSILEGIADGLHSLSDWINEHQETVQNFIILIGTLGTALGIAWIIYSAVTAFTALGGIMGIVSVVGGVLGGVMAFLTSPITLIILAIAALIAIGIMLYKNWDEVKEFGLMCWDTVKEGLSTAWEKIKDVFSKVGEFFKNVWTAVKQPFINIADWFENIFSKAWEAVRNVFSKGGEVFNGIKDGILDSLKNVINGLIDGINTVISIPFGGINSALDGIKGIEIVGKHPFEWLPSIDIPQIPRLATGTVVPANYGEFAAILGDNKREPEIVAPEGAIKRAVIEAMVESGLFNKSNDGEIIINIDGREVFRAVKNQNGSHKRTHGGRSALA